MKAEYIGAVVAFVTAGIAGRWASLVLRKGYRIMESQGVDTDMRVGWQHLRSADVSLSRQYAIGLTVVALCGIAGVILLVLGYFAESFGK